MSWWPGGDEPAALRPAGGRTGRRPGPRSRTVSTRSPTVRNGSCAPSPPSAESPVTSTTSTFRTVPSSSTRCTGSPLWPPPRKPKMFVLPSDPDFVRILNDPSVRGAKYLLAVPPTGRGRSDTLNKRDTRPYDNGADVATLELEIPNDGDGQPDWRLYLASTNRVRACNVAHGSRVFPESVQRQDRPRHPRFRSRTGGRSPHPPRRRERPMSSTSSGTMSASPPGTASVVWSICPR